MTFTELDALLVGRYRERKKISSLLIAIRQNPSTIQINRRWRAAEMPLASFTRDNRVRFLPDPYAVYWPKPILESANALLPLHSYVLEFPHNWYYRDNVMWRKNPAPVTGWRQAYAQVHVPYTKGDTFDTDLRYLHAARRNDF